MIEISFKSKGNPNIFTIYTQESHLFISGVIFEFLALCIEFYIVRLAYSYVLYNKNVFSN